MAGGQRNESGVSAEQIRAEQHESARRSQESARRVARPVNFAANAILAVWTALLAITCS